MATSRKCEKEWIDFFKSIYQLHQNDIDYLMWHYETVKHFQPKQGLELGFGWGFSAIGFLLGSKGNLISVDIDWKKQQYHGDILINNQEKAEKEIKNEFADRFLLYRTGVQKFFQNVKHPKADWLYIDTSHDYISVFRDFTLSIDSLKDGGILCLDDYYKTHAVADLYEEIKRYGWQEVFSPSAYDNHHEIKMFKKPKGFYL